MIETIMSIWGEIPELIKALGAVVLAVKSITMITPSTSDDAVVNKILKVLNFLALNIFKDKNKDAE